MRRILIAEDEERISRFIHKGLRAAGWTPSVVADGITALDHAMSGEFDLMILDLGLPRLDGFTVLQLLRQSRLQLPVIILTARTSVADTIAGLDGGADDYLAKPFSMLELVARVKALFRRQEAMSRNLRMDAGVLSFNDLTIDPIAREVHLHQQPVELTPREFDLLYFFARHPGQVFSRLSLLNQVWGYQHEGYEHTVNTHINRLRIKIERNPAEPERILTVWGMGYKFAATPHE